MSRLTFRTMCGWLGVAGVIAVWLAWAYSRFFPQDFIKTGPLYIAAEWVAFMVRTFWLHLGIAAVVAVVLVLIGRSRWRWGWAAAGAALAIIAAGPALYSARPKDPPPISGRGTLRIVSANVRFDNRQFDAVLDVLLAADADVLILPEFTHAWHRATHERLAVAYPHFAHELSDLPGALAVYSRVPFDQAVTTDIGGSLPHVPQMRTVVRIGGREVALYAIHLATPHVPSAERRLQFAALLEQMRGEAIPGVAAGDFNFTDTSPQADALREAEFRNTHDLAGRGFGHTWPATGLRSWVITPDVRIDHVYLSPALTVVESRVIDLPGSDHRGIVAMVGLADAGR